MNNTLKNFGKALVNVAKDTGKSMGTAAILVGGITAVTGVTGAIWNVTFKK